MPDRFSPHTRANSGKAPRPARNIHVWSRCRMRFAWSSTISTSATVFMISRCPATTSNDCNQAPVRAASESLRVVLCYPSSSVFIFLCQSRLGGFSLCRSRTISRSIRAGAACSRSSRATSRTASPAPVVVHAVHSPRQRGFPFKLIARLRSCPAISLTASSVLPSGKSGLFFAIYGQIPLARRSVSRRMASSACRCASTSAVTGSPFPAPGWTLLSGISPHAATGDGTGIPRTTFTGDSHHHTAVGVITGNPDTTGILSASRLSPLRLPCRATRTAHPRCLSHGLHLIPQPVSVIRGQRVQPDTADLPLRSNAWQCRYGCGSTSRQQTVQDCLPRPAPPDEERHGLPPRPAAPAPY